MVGGQIQPKNRSKPMSEAHLVSLRTKKKLKKRDIHKEEPGTDVERERERERKDGHWRT